MDATFHIANGSVLAAREVELGAVGPFTAGGNLVGSNAVGIGIGCGQGPVVGTPEQYTLLDQDNAARIPQRSQVIGGVGLTTSADWPSSGGVEGKATLPIEAGAATADGSGEVTGVGLAGLASLAAGWVNTVI